ncbi:amino acid adenylation domain-containing protein [Streptomyces nanshensis]|uniref:Non-ribosomal peptide synthetase n=1 Tax=Streptomyces nanshensis TaxID=518642 RepID=A0A1E7LBV7_9ACTN|nr:non-ribosomal peptide synthetase [Streptomyces nanshensis]OEV13581.1 non-ribosomal peptide synthetase [Streptomyces nanshensis]
MQTSSLFPLTAYQLDIWGVAGRREESPQFNCVLHERMDGKVVLETLAQAVRNSLGSHDALRLRFDERDGVPYQWISGELPGVRVLDLSSRPDPAVACAEWMEESLRTPVPLRRGPMTEATILVESDQVVHFHLRAHHLVTDGWTYYLLGVEIREEYAALLEGAASRVRPSSYREFAEEEGRYRDSEQCARDRAFHRSALDGVSPALFTRKETPTAPPVVRTSCAVPGDVVARLLAEGVSPFAYVAALLGTYLSRVHDSDEVVLGIPFMNREGAEQKAVVGDFANTLPVRVRPGDHGTLREVAADVRAKVSALREHGRLALGEVLREVPQLPPDERQLFDITLSYLRHPSPESTGEVVRTVDYMAPHHDQDAVNIVMLASGDSDDISLNLECAGDVFDADRPAGSFARHLGTLLRSGAGLLDSPVRDVPMLDEDEYGELVAGRGHGPVVDFPRDATLASLFQEQAARSPERTAVVAADGAGSLTYAELDARSNQVARALQSEGAGRGDRVAVLMECGPDLIVALFGVLKAGAAYVPVDPEHPPARARLLLRDSGAGVVLVEDKEAAVELFADADEEPVASSPGGGADGELPAALVLADLANGPEGPVASGPTADDLAYVIYTSGSTGTPKGVMVRHRSVVNRLAWMQRRYPLTQDDSVLQKTPFSFDVSVWELFWWAIEGARCVLLPAGGQRDPRVIARTVREHAVTVAHFVPSMLGPFLDVLSSPGEDAPLPLRHVFASGEALPAPRVEQFNRVLRANGRSAARLVNLYGPTEATVDVSFYDCPDDPSLPVVRVPIGRPIDNTQLYVLRSDGSPQPVGVPGELWIGGAGVAEGYLNRPDLTAAAFTDDPFTPGGRLYRTGDRARWLADGTLEYLGRLDGQVKIRGNRVEPQEAAAALLKVPGVRDAVVVDRTSAARGTHLVGYYVADEDLDPAALRDELAAHLPQFMVPALFVRIDRVPLTPNGKADRRALPSPQAAPRAEEAERASLSAAQAVLTEVWQEVLGMPVGLHDDYYALGGDSILMLRIRALAEQRGLRFSLTDLMHAPSVAALAARAEARAVDGPDGDGGEGSESGEGGGAALAPFALVDAADREKLAGASDAHPLSALQLGLLYDSREPGSSTYKDVFRYTLRMPWEEDAFREAFGRLVERHPALRSSFDLASFSEPLQITHPAAPGGLESADLRQLDEERAEFEILRHVEERRHHDYALTRAPLWLLRAHVRRKHVDLVLSFHHALLDGASVANVLSELLQDYAHTLGLGPGPVPESALPSPAHHARDERLALDSPEHGAYWAETLEGAAPLRLESFRPHEPAGGTGTGTGTGTSTGTGASTGAGTAAATRSGMGVLLRRVELPEETGRLLRRLAAERELPVKSVLFAAHCLTLGLFGGEDVTTGPGDVTTGLIVHNRPQLAHAERIAGLFLNTVPVRVDVSGPTWFDVAREAFGQERSGHPHQRRPLSAIRGDAGRAAAVGTVFNYVHFRQLGDVLRLPGVELTAFRTWEETGFALLVNAVTDPVDERVWLRIDCDSGQFTDAQADLLAATYSRVLHRMLEQPDAEVDFAFLAGAAKGPSRAIPSAQSARTDAEDVVSLFARQAERTPERTAVVLDGTRWTYARLHAAAESVAGRLLALGARPGSRVGIAMGRTPGTVACVLGVLRAGAAVVPLDPSYPERRLADMAEQAELFRVVTDDGNPAAFAGPALVLRAEELLAPDAATAGACAASRTARQPLDPGSVAYVLFTSGSTGRPKGVAMPHRALANLVNWQISEPSGAAGDVTLQYAPLSFDVSFQEIFSTLCSGGTLRLVAEETRRDMPALLRLLDEGGVRRVFLPYVALQQLAEASAALGLVPGALRILVSSGEQLRVTEEIRRLCAALPGSILENQYGPTETHVATRYSMSGDPAAFPSLPPIGTPIGNATALVLDHRMRPAPAGARGELYLGGACLAEGYVGRPDLTGERFVETAEHVEPVDGEAMDGETAGGETVSGGRLYRTGDTGFVLPDGNIVCTGRADRQAKIRGHRVEPAEVELALTAFAEGHEGLGEAAVVAREDGSGGTVLAAFVTGDAEAVTGDAEAVGPAAVRRHLRSVLPEYMVPSYVQWVDAMPLTPSGKRDDAALCRLPLTAGPTRRDATEPRDEYEAALAEMLADLLRQPGIGVHDDLFDDLGCTSLTVMRLVVAVEQRYGVVIPLATFVATPTVAQLAPHLHAFGMPEGTSGTSGTEGGGSSGKGRRAGSAGSASGFDPLVPIRRDGTKPPLFMVHPMGGNVLCYLPLARHLPADQPFYALQAAGAEPGTAPLTTMEEIAESYVAALRRVQPTGPYTIGGWSFGGFAAFEMARQLRACGEEVARLVLLDTTTIGTDSRRSFTDDALLGWFFWELLWIRGGDGSPLAELPSAPETLEEKFDHIARHATRLGALPEGSSGLVVRRLFDVYKANWYATLSYSPGSADQDVTLLRAQEPLPEVLASMHGAAGSRHAEHANGWDRTTGGRVEVVPVPGDHLTLMREPHVAHTAAAVTALLPHTTTPRRATEAVAPHVTTRRN